MEDGDERRGEEQIKGNKRKKNKAKGEKSERRREDALTDLSDCDGSQYEGNINNVRNFCLKHNITNISSVYKNINLPLYS